MFGKDSWSHNGTQLCNTYAKVWETAPYVSAAGMQTLLNFSVSPAGKTAKPDQFIDNSFIAELDKSRASSKNYKT